MKYQEFLNLSHEYEIQSVEAFISLVNRITTNMGASSNAVSAFQEAFFEKERLAELTEPTDGDIKSYLKYLRDSTPFASMIPAANPMFPEKTKTEFFFRGVYNGESFNLLPSALRGNRYGKESAYYHNVKAQCAGDYVGISQINTLVKMQHYECPTRLLDLTSNPLVALYFASKNFGCEACQKSNYGYVYVFVNPANSILFNDSDKAVALSCLAKLDLRTQKALYASCINKIKKFGFRSVFDANNNGVAVEKLYHEIRQERDFEKKLKPIDLLQNYYFQPDKTNNRIKLQSGAFLIPGIHESQKDYLESLEYEYYLKIRIRDQQRVLEELDRLNINEASLFPEADKVAHYYSEKL